MRKCWAAALGGCDTKISREHIVSEALWSGPSVTVVGFPWCRDTPREIGLGSLTTRILCVSHNSGLSPVDQAAADAFDALRRATALANRRRDVRPRKWKRVRFQANGPLLERWFLKTAVSMAAAQRTDAVWHWDGSPIASPGPQLVRWAFGEEAFLRPVGLYCAASVGGGFNLSDSVEAAPLFDLANRAHGFLFIFRGVRFVLWLSHNAPPDPLVLPGVPQDQWRTNDLMYRLAYMRWMVGGRLSHYVDFLWPGRKPLMMR